MPAVQVESASAGAMIFYFCEKCGKRVTGADLARGQGRDKQLKGVHCAACSEGTQTVAFDAISQAEVWKEEQARRQGQRRSTSTRMPAANADGTSPRRGRSRLAFLSSRNSSLGVVWAVLALVLCGGVGVLIAMGGGSRRTVPVTSNQSRETTPKPRAAASSQKPSTGSVAQVPEPTNRDTQVPLPIPAAQAPEPTKPENQMPSASPDSQPPAPATTDTLVSAPSPETEEPEPAKTASDSDREPVVSTGSEVNHPTDVERCAEADAYTRGGRFAGKNFGTAPNLATKEDGWQNKMFARRAYIRFDLSTFPASIASAKLRIYATNVGADAGMQGVELVADDTWKETAINWGNAPAPTGSVLATWKPVAGQFAELDLTAAVQNELAGDKKISLLIYATSATGGNRQADFASREAETADRRPRLIVNR